VKKGNVPYEFNTTELPFEKFKIHSDFNGKKIVLNLVNKEEIIKIYLFMGMSGSIKWVKTSEWPDTKYTRLRFDSNDGFSLLIYGGYLGPKYSIKDNFKSSVSGPDIIKEYDNFENNVTRSLNNKEFEKPIYEVLLNQKYFAGVGNYLRSTIIYYADVDPFLSARNVILNNKQFLPLCKQILEHSYKLNGGQLKDWNNPFNIDSDKFDDWVFYKRGESIKDKQGRTFWYNPKWSK